MGRCQRAETDAQAVPPELGDHALEQTDQGDCAISLTGVIQELSECHPVSCALELLLEQGGWPRSPLWSLLTSFAPSGLEFEKASVWDCQLLCLGMVHVN